MITTALRSRPLIPPQDDMLHALYASLLRPPERMVVAISSKVVAIHQGRCVQVSSDEDITSQKDAHAIQESDRYVPRDPSVPFGRLFTITSGTLISNAGIDQSNANGYFVLWPRDPMHAAHTIRETLRERYGVRELGVIITDSAGAPLRNGVTGITIGYAGFHAQHDYRGTPDIFGRPLKAERLNIADSLAAAAVLAMGEGNECTPFALLEDIPHIEFAETEADDPFLALQVSMEDDVFAPFFGQMPWRRGGGNAGC